MSVYNGEKYIRDQIDSILASTGVNFRLFIFDDCSTDSTLAIAEEYANKYKHKVYAFKNPVNMGSTKSFLYNLKRVSDKINENKKIVITNSINGDASMFRRLLDNGEKIGLKTKAVRFKNKAIHTIKGGAGVIKNKAFVIKDKAVAIAKQKLRKNKDVLVSKEKEKISKVKVGQYYMFCDQDDVWLKDKISLTLKKLSRVEIRHGKHKPAMVYTDAILVDERLKYINRSFYRTNHMKGGKADLGSVLMENKCIGCTCMFNQALCDLLGNNYEGVRYHDWWMALIGVTFGNIKFIKTPTLMYRQHHSNQVGQTSFKDYFNNRFKDKSDNKRRLEETRIQAEHFYHEYYGMFKKKHDKMLRAFVNLDLYTPVMKRVMLFRYGFFKSGIIRNIGLLLTI